MRWIVHILVLMTIVGCNNQTAHDAPSLLGGVTLSNIMPIANEESIPVMSFMVSVFLVDVEEAQAVRGCLEDLSDHTVRYRDQEAFEKNGLWASFGTGMQIGPVGDCLTRSGVQRLEQTSLMLNSGLELPFGPMLLDQTQSIVYHDLDGRITTTSLAAGVVGWSLRAERIPDTPGRLRAGFEPVFTPWAARHWSGSASVADQLSRRFEAGCFDVTMRSADFIVLGPQHMAIDEFSDLERLLFLTADSTDQMRFYVILCVRVES